MKEGQGEKGKVERRQKGVRKERKWKRGKEGKRESGKKRKG